MASPGSGSLSKPVSSWMGGVALYAATLADPAVLLASSEVVRINFLWGVVTNAVLALAAYAARSVTRSGALWGSVLGTALYTCGGWQLFLILLLFVLLGTAATKLGYSRKAALGIAQERGGRRTACNVFANTSVGVFCGFLALATPWPAIFLVAAAAAFATAACDTVSSEVGQAYGRRHYLVTTFRQVPAGTDGAVSLVGTLAGIAAAALLAITAQAVGIVSAVGAWIVVVSAFGGATAESYLGATLERAQLIANDMINFANTAAGGVTALLLALWLL